MKYTALHPSMPHFLNSPDEGDFNCDCDETCEEDICDCGCHYEEFEQPYYDTFFCFKCHMGIFEEDPEKDNEEVTKWILKHLHDCHDKEHGNQVWQGYDDGERGFVAVRQLCLSN